MYVELYRTNLEKIDPSLPDIESNSILKATSTNYLIRSSYIVDVAIEPTIIDGKKYHHVELSEDNFQTKLYITANDYERVTRAMY